MKNKITDLNNHLFAVIERLGDEDLTPEELEKEIQRASAIRNVAGAVIEISRLQVDAMALMLKGGVDLSDMKELPLGLGKADDNQLKAGK